MLSTSDSEWLALCLRDRIAHVTSGRGGSDLVPLAEVDGYSKANVQALSNNLPVLGQHLRVGA
eukprot:4260588-Alexandrium_andersonii.AAC.1